MKMFRLSHGIVYVVLLLQSVVFPAFAQSAQTTKSKPATSAPDSTATPSETAPQSEALQGEENVPDPEAAPADNTPSAEAAKNSDGTISTGNEAVEKSDTSETVESTEDSSSEADTAAPPEEPAPTPNEAAAKTTTAASNADAPPKAAESESDTAASSGQPKAKTPKDVDAEAVVTSAATRDNYTAKSVPRTDRIINILTAQTVRPGALTLTIDHRAHDSFWSGEDAWFDYLGLDSGNLKIGIGLRLGLKEYMDLGFYRLSNGTDQFDVYEFDTKMRFLNQSNSYVNASLRIGLSWFVQDDAQDAAGFFSQVNVDRRLFGTPLLGTGFAFHTNSTNDRKLYEDNDQSAAILGYVEWRPVRRFSLNGEMAAAVAGYKSKYPVFAFSTRFLTHRHSFSLVLSNTQYMNADGFVTNTWRAFDELVFGFQIVREFQLIDN